MGIYRGMIKKRGALLAFFMAAICAACDSRISTPDPSHPKVDGAGIENEEPVPPTIADGQSEKSVDVEVVTLYSPERSLTDYVGNDPTQVARYLSARKLSTYFPPNMPDEFSSSDEVNRWISDYKSVRLPIIPIFVEKCQNSRGWSDNDLNILKYGITFDKDKELVTAGLFIDPEWESPGSDETVCKSDMISRLSQYFPFSEIDDCGKYTELPTLSKDEALVSSLDASVSDISSRIIIYLKGDLRKRHPQDTFSKMWQKSMQLKSEGVLVSGSMTREEARAHFENLGCIVFFQPTDQIWYREMFYSSRYGGWVRHTLFGNYEGVALFDTETGRVFAEHVVD